MKEKAYGKINVGLNIVGKREDGYHLLDMIMVPVDIYDTLEITIADNTSFTSNTSLPWDKRNLIYRAVELMKERYGLKHEYEVRLTKRIPEQAGMAGGSSDAAAALRLINRLEKLDLSLEQLAEIGVRLGADVPFCVYSRPARVQGIGEKIRLLELKEGYDVLLVKPAKGVSTAECFRLADESDCAHPDIDELERRFLNHEDMTGIIGNSLEASAIKLLPEIAEIKQELIREGFANPLMTGSGSAVFALLEKGIDCEGFINKGQKKYDFCIKTTLL